MLTVNQVFEILIKWVETKDWERSLYSVIPKRKFQQEGKGNLEANIDAATVVDDDVENEPVQQEDLNRLVVEDVQLKDTDDVSGWYTCIDKLSDPCYVIFALLVSFSRQGLYQVQGFSS